MRLEYNEVCPYKDKCPFVADCMGTSPTRNSEFVCHFISFDKVGNPQFTKDRNLRETEFNTKGGNKILHG